MMTANLKGEDGFTLIEVILAGAIIAVAIIPLLYALTAGLNFVSESSRDSLMATTLLSERSEELKSSPFDGLNPGVQIENNYANSGYDLKTIISSVSNMTDDEGNVVVKKIVVEIYKEDKLIDTYAFLIYKEGF